MPKGEGSGGCTGKGFLPKQSGNPGGKSKEQRAIEAQFVEAITEIKLEYKETGKKPKLLPCMVALTKKLVNLAYEKEQSWAWKLLFMYLLPPSFNVSVWMQHSGKVETGPQIVDIEAMLLGMGVSPKKAKEARNHYLEEMFPGRGFGKKEIEVRQKPKGKKRAPA